MEKLVAFLSRREIEEKVKFLSQRISKDYQGKDLVLIGVLKGAFIFLADLAREITLPVAVDFVQLASYGIGTVSSGQIRLTKDIELDVTGKHVLIVDDIIDSGLTMAFLIDHLLLLKPLSVKVCVFIDNRQRRVVKVPIDYVGCVVKSGFLVGYGLNCRERHRTLPEIFEIVEEKANKKD